MANKNKRRNHTRLMRIKRWIKLNYYKVMRIDDPPYKIAKGVAIGVFMGIFPTFGLGIILSVLLAYILKANKAAAVIGSFIMNPLTTPFFWTLSAVVGSVMFWEDRNIVMSNMKNFFELINGISLTSLLNKEEMINMIHAILNDIGGAYMIFLVGNLVVSSAFSAAAYFITKRWVIAHRKKKAMRMLVKRNM